MEHCKRKITTEDDGVSMDYIINEGDKSNLKTWRIQGNAAHFNEIWSPNENLEMSIKD